MNRSPNGINVHRFLEGYGVKVLPYHMKRDPRPANVVYGGRDVARLKRKGASDSTIGEKYGLRMGCRA